MCHPLVRAATAARCILTTFKHICMLADHLLHTQIPSQTYIIADPASVRHSPHMDLALTLRTVHTRDVAVIDASTAHVQKDPSQSTRSSRSSTFFAVCARCSLAGSASCSLRPSTRSCCRSPGRVRSAASVRTQRSRQRVCCVLCSVFRRCSTES